LHIGFVFLSKHLDQHLLLFGDAESENDIDTRSKAMKNQFAVTRAMLAMNTMYAE
jgi:hypothetical protein